MDRTRSAEKSVALKRASSRQWVLKPQDLAIALKLVALRGQWLPYAALGDVMHMSRFEAHAAVQRLIAAGLVAATEGPPWPVLAAVQAFVVYGARYAYPPVRGGQTIGFPTAHGVAPLSQMMVPSQEPAPIWPHPQGPVRGQALLPLYEKLPLAAMEDEALYQLLALFDALRAGQARESELATQLLKERLSGSTVQKSVRNEGEDRMKIGANLDVSHKALDSLVKRFHIRKLALFGSAARGELRPDSDIDLLIEFEPGSAPSLWSATELQGEFSRLFGGRPVDILPPEALRNPYRRKTIERDLKVLVDEAA
jgi:predicted nucleotidyltransferase